MQADRPPEIILTMFSHETEDSVQSKQDSEHDLGPNWKWDEQHSVKIVKLEPPLPLVNENEWAEDEPERAT